MKFTSGTSVKQRTVKHPVTVKGVGFRTGRAITMSISPADADSGIQFVQNNLDVKNIVTARWHSVIDTEIASSEGIGSGINVSTIEHLMAAFYDCGIDNAVVELNAPEPPIMDGSAQSFIDLIEKTGTQTQASSRKVIWLQRPIEIRHGKQYAILTPAEIPRITTEIEFPDTTIGSQTFSVELINDAIQKNIARARTFRFEEELPQLRDKELALGCSAKNTVIISRDPATNMEELRYKDEYVRHITLDCLGDLALIGVPVLAHLYVRRPDPVFMSKIIQQLFKKREAWAYIPIEELGMIAGYHDSPHTNDCSNKIGWNTLTYGSSG